MAVEVKTRVSKAMTPPAEQDLEASEGGKKILYLHYKVIQDPSKDEESMQTGSKALPSLLALPIEVHLQIILNLGHSTDPSQGRCRL